MGSLWSQLWCVLLFTLAMVGCDQQNQMVSLKLGWTQPISVTDGMLAEVPVCFLPSGGILMLKPRDATSPKGRYIIRDSKTGVSLGEVSGDLVVGGEYATASGCIAIVTRETGKINSTRPYRVVVYETKSWKPIGEHLLQADKIAASAVGSDGSFVIVGASGDSLYCWVSGGRDGNSLVALRGRELPALRGQVKAASISPDRTKVGVCDGEQAVVWDVQKGAVVGRWVVSVDNRRPLSRPSEWRSITPAKGGNRTVTDWGNGETGAVLREPREGYLLEERVTEDGKFCIRVFPKAPLSTDPVRVCVNDVDAGAIVASGCGDSPS